MPKYTLQFADRSYNDLDALAKQLGMPKANVVRDALSAYRWIVDELQGGAKLLLQRGDNVRELVLPAVSRAPAAVATASEVSSSEAAGAAS